MSKIRSGIVISNAADKTAIVRTDRMVPHKKYGKRYRISTKFAVHDADNTTQVGDVVLFQETRPISKSKKWVLVSKVSAADAKELAAGQ